MNFILCLCRREQDELTRQVEASVSDQERKELQMEQERLLLKMERKGEQISKLYRHKTQVGFHTETVQFTQLQDFVFLYSFLISPLDKEVKKGNYL